MPSMLPVHELGLAELDTDRGVTSEASSGKKQGDGPEQWFHKHCTEPVNRIAQH